MRYPASDKAEIIRLVEQSHLPVRRTLEKLGIASRCTSPMVWTSGFSHSLLVSWYVITF
jgi:hypothetical protein